MSELVRAQLNWTVPGEDGDSMTFGVIEAMVNPTEISFNKGAHFADAAIPGLDAPVLQFVRGEAETLEVELFFDTTETGDPVTQLTDQVYGLVKIHPEQHAPPICLFAWGEDFPGKFLGDTDHGGIEEQSSQARESFQCVVKRVQQRFTLFAENGRPLRAILTLSLEEYRPVEEQIDELDLRSNDRTRQHVVSEGETLPGIAARVLGRAADWRVIADHNQLSDPLAITAGMILEVPRLR